MLIIVTIVVLLVLEILLAIAFGFLIYKDWQCNQRVLKIKQKLIIKNKIEEDLELILNNENN